MHHESLQPFYDRAEKGLIRVVEQGKLVLFNYTDACTFERAWDDWTIKARGIIFEKETGQIVARPFDKFFNYNEYMGIFGQHSLDETLKKPHYIQEKFDGSLGIVYWYDEKWNIATRGSFSSEQAIRGAEILKKYKMPQAFVPAYRKPTYLVEIIYPENKIIVPYGDNEELVLLAIRNTQNGNYGDRGLVIGTGYMLGMRCASPVNLSIEGALELQKTIPYHEEGWVVVFGDGTRLKIKGDDYMRIAKFKANLSPIAVWEAMTAGSYLAMQIACPEEILGELESIEARLKSDIQVLSAKVLSQAEQINWDVSRKETAIQIQQTPEWMQGALFARLTGKYSVEKCVIKLLRPTNNQYVDVSIYDQIG